MSKNLIIGILILITVTVCIMNYLNTRRPIEPYGGQQSASLFNEIAFLERSLDYAMLRNDERTKISPLVNIVMYYSSQSCNTCVQDFLLNYKDTPNLQDKLLIIVDEKIKEEVIINFNDSFGTNFNYLLDTTQYFRKSIDDVLLLKVEDQNIAYVLEYRPENHEIFDQYFRNKGYINNNKESLNLADLNQ